MADKNPTEDLEADEIVRRLKYGIHNDILSDCLAEIVAEEIRKEIDRAVLNELLRGN